MADDYFNKIPLWDNNYPNKSFDILNDNISGRIPVTRIEKWQDFDSIISNSFFERQDKEIVYRGQRRYDWSLQPSLARISRENGIISKDLADKQLDIFKKAIRGRISDNALLDEDDELWSIGQHHGLMTPLLDWTHSPYVALFFAFSKEDQIDEQDNPYRAVYILNKTFITECEDGIGIRLFEPKKDDYGRLVSQDGLFTFSPYGATIENKLIDYLIEQDEITEKWEDENSTEQEEARIIAQNICKIYIKNESSYECVKHLIRMNVHHGSLFPDLQGAAEFSNLSMAEDSIIIKNSKIRSTRKIKNYLERNNQGIRVIHSSMTLGFGDKEGAIKELLTYKSKGLNVEENIIQNITNALCNELSKITTIPSWAERDDLTSSIINKTRVILRKHSYPEQSRRLVQEQIIDVLKTNEVIKDDY